MKKIIISFLCFIMFLACDVPEYDFNEFYDADPPALVFQPFLKKVVAGSVNRVDIEALEIIGTAGMYIKMEYDPDFKTDRLCSGILDFGSQSATFTCATQLTPYQRVNIFGTEGRVEIEIPFNAPPDRPCRIWHQQADEIEEIVLEICDQYTIQGDLFSLAVLNNTEVPTPLKDSAANMKVLEALVRSSESETWSRL